jgi:hypothetical protein
MLVGSHMILYTSFHALLAFEFSVEKNAVIPVRLPFRLLAISLLSISLLCNA